MQKVSHDRYKSCGGYTDGANEFHARYLNEDYMLLGTGFFACVFLHHPSGVAVKFGGIINVVDTYPVFAKLCMERNLRFLPEVYAHKDYPQHYYTVMKQYEENREPVPSSYLRDLIHTDCTSLRERESIDNLTKNYPQLGELVDEILETCRAIREIAGFGMVDLHSQNVMRDRHTGDFIITDPFSWVKSKPTAAPAWNERVAGLPQMQAIPKPRIDATPGMFARFKERFIHRDMQCVIHDDFMRPCAIYAPKHRPPGARNKEFQQFNVQPRAMRANFFNINC